MTTVVSFKNGTHGSWCFSNKTCIIFKNYIIIIEYRKKVSKNNSRKLKKKNKTIIKDRYFRFQTWGCQNVYDEVLLGWFKFQTKIPSPFGVTFNDKRVTKILPPFTPFSKDEGLRDIGHSMSIGNLILGANSVTISYLIHYDNLLQLRQILLQNLTAILLQNETEVYYKMRLVFYYKMRRLLQIATLQI